MSKTSTVETRGGEVTATLFEQDGMPHLSLSGRTGTHTIAVPDHFGGAARALGHAEGFISDGAYGESRAVARDLAAELVGALMTLPAPLAYPPSTEVAPHARAVTFEFDRTESTGYVRVYATWAGKVYKVATAGRSRVARHWSSESDAPRTWSHVLSSVPKAVREAAAAAKVGERAEAMARRWVQPRKAR